MNGGCGNSGATKRTRGRWALVGFIAQSYGSLAHVIELPASRLWRAAASVPLRGPPALGAELPPLRVMRYAALRSTAAESFTGGAAQSGSEADSGSIAT